MPKETKQVGWQVGAKSAWVELADDVHLTDTKLVSYRVSKKQRLPTEANGASCLQTQLVTGPQAEALEAAKKLAKEFVEWPK